MPKLKIEGWEREEEGERIGRRGVIETKHTDFSISCILTIPRLNIAILLFMVIICVFVSIEAMLTSMSFISLSNTASLAPIAHRVKAIVAAD